MSRGPVGSWRRLAAAVVVVGVLVLVEVAPASAAPTVEVDAPSQVTVGEQVVVGVTVTEAGDPVVGADVELSFLARVGGESGWVVVDTATTNEVGLASFEYQQRALDASRMRVGYFGPDGLENTEFSLDVIDGDQLIVSDVGADIPILGVWWIVAVLGIVWLLVVLAVVGVVRVGQASESGERSAKAIPRIMVSFVVLTAVGMFIVVLSRPDTHANLDPTADFDRVPRSVVGTAEGYEGFGLGDPSRDRSQEVGKDVFVQAGCASCHGPQGLGGSVGGAITGPEAGSAEVRLFDDLIEEVRKGPKGMPAYDETVLSDEDVAKILDYLTEAVPP